LFKFLFFLQRNQSVTSGTSGGTLQGETEEFKGEKIEVPRHFERHTWWSRDTGKRWIKHEETIIGEKTDEFV